MLPFRRFRLDQLEISLAGYNGWLLYCRNSHLIQCRLTAHLFLCDYPQKRLIVRPRLIAPDIGKSKINHCRTDIAVLELYGGIRATIQRALQTPPMLSLVEALSSQFQRQHLQIVRNDSFYFFA